jgi:hypothetical protein
MLAARVLGRVSTACIMSRQQTLRKFFEMPKNAKPAPTQQASLSDMWGGKKKEKEVVPQEGPDNQMDTDDGDKRALQVLSLC